MNAGPIGRLAACVIALAAGCAGPTIEPLRPDGGPPPTDAGPLDCTDGDAVRVGLLQPLCGDSDCHDDRRSAAELDLVSPGLSERLMGQTSIHEECAGREIVVPGVARASFLMDKVLGTHDTRCGDPMPSSTTSLSVEERRCLVQWIDALRP